ncbi:hypothetical protein NMY22_g7375 [Coprinellus aureogranulatus]|nr:hypothetical protein NMY22_g7375 [Coprinellus aureogranulatus]
MSVFQGAHDFGIGRLSITNYNQAETSPRDRLYSKIAPGAIHDSTERYDAPKCFEQTRKAVQHEIVSWGVAGQHEVEPKDVLWLTGPAGAGKSAIAGSVAETCHEMGRLAATFFFSSFAGSGRRRFKRYLVPTLAYQLAQHQGFGTYAARLYTVIQHDPAIFDKNLRTQVGALLLGPLREMRERDRVTFPSAIVIIDGVDEVQAEGRDTRAANEADQREVILALLQAAKSDHFPFRILISSRPERVIRETLSKAASSITTLFLDDKYNPDSDIELFLLCKFSEIRSRYGLPSSWPSEQAIQQLVHMASGQFIFAHTVVLCILDGINPPTVRLDDILEIAEPSREEGPLKPLYALYEQVLMSSPNPELAAAWLQSISTATLVEKPVFFVRQLLEDSSEGTANYLLDNLSSLVYTPPSEFARSQPYHIYHRSLCDYLYQDPSFMDEYDDLKEKKIVAVLKKKAPLNEPAAAHWDYFLPHFIDAALGCCYQIFEAYSFFDKSENGDLAQCDVAWWMHTIVAISPDIGSAQDAMSRFFSDVHISCSRGRPCSAACKHWRLNILKFCSATFRDWRTPSPSLLLRERMYRQIQCLLLESGEDRGPDYDEEFRRLILECGDADEDEHMDFLFYPSTRPNNPNCHDFQAHGTDALGAYNRLLDVVDRMYSELPKDWKKRYLKERLLGVTVFEVLRDEIDNIA